MAGGSTSEETLDRMTVELEGRCALLASEDYEPGFGVELGHKGLGVVLRRSADTDGASGRGGRGSGA